MSEYTESLRAEIADLTRQLHMLRDQAGEGSCADEIASLRCELAKEREHRAGAAEQLRFFREEWDACAKDAKGAEQLLRKWVDNEDRRLRLLRVAIEQPHVTKETAAVYVQLQALTDETNALLGGR